MRISTYENLDRVPLGETVQVRNQPWTRVEDGLRDATGTTLPLITFRGVAEAGQLTTNAEAGPDLPQWYRHYENDYLVVGPGKSTQYVALRFRRGMFQTTEDWNLNTVNTITKATDPATMPDGEQWVAAWRAALPVVAEAPKFFGADYRQGMVTADLIKDLHEIAPDVAGLDDLLFKHNVGRTRNGTVTVSARGTAKVTPEQFGGVEVDDTEVGWKFSYDYSTFTVITAPCLCGTFDEEKFKTRLPVNTVSEVHECVCSESDCVNKKEGSE